MALINCPECVKEISDRVKTCPHCGYPLIEEIVEHQKVEIAAVHLEKMDKGKKKKIVVALVSVLLLISVLVVGYIAYNNNQVRKAEQGYTDNMNMIMLNMLISGGNAEELMNLTAQVWYNTIYEKSDSVTDKFTKSSSGYSFVSDFNTALGNLSSDSDTVEKINKIKSSQAEISDIMKKLQNPPETYKKIYDTLLELYSNYQGVTDLAISPQGNLTSFSNSKNEKIDKFMELYKKLQTLMPNKE